MNATHLVTAVRIADYLPVMSTATNLFILFQKFYYRHTEFPNTHYYDYIQDKTYFECIVLLVPIIGNLLVVLSNHRTLMNACLRSYEDALAYGGAEIRKDRAFMKQAISRERYGDSLRFAGLKLRKDPEFYKEILQETTIPFKAGCLRYMDTGLRNDPEFIKSCLRLINSNRLIPSIIMKNIGDTLQQNPSFFCDCWEIVGPNLIFLRYDDPTAFLESIKSGIDRLWFADESLKRDKKFIEHCAQENPIALLVASPELTQDGSFMLERIEQDILAAAFIDPELLKNKAFIESVREKHLLEKVQDLLNNPLIEEVLSAVAEFRGAQAGKYEILRDRVVTSFNALREGLSASSSST